MIVARARHLAHEIFSLLAALSVSVHCTTDKSVDPTLDDAVTHHEDYNSLTVRVELNY